MKTPGQCFVAAEHGRCCGCCCFCCCCCHRNRLAILHWVGSISDIAHTHTVDRHICASALDTTFFDKPSTSIPLLYYTLLVCFVPISTNNIDMMSTVHQRTVSAIYVRIADRRVFGGICTRVLLDGPRSISGAAIWRHRSNRYSVCHTNEFHLYEPNQKCFCLVRKKTNSFLWHIFRRIIYQHSGM